MNYPEFSVLISVYKKENCFNLNACLNSILTQSLKPSEVVIVKDGPLPADLENYIDNFSEAHEIVKVVALAENRGLATALNFGIQICSFDYIARMDADDIAVPERFAIQFKAIIEEPRIRLIGGFVQEFEKDAKTLSRIRKVPIEHSQIITSAKKFCPFNHPTVIYRKKDVLDVGGYDASFFQEDYHLWMKMLATGIYAVNLPEVLVYMRTGQDFFKRRKGIKYAKNEFSFFYSLYRDKHLNLLEFLLAGIPRFCIRLLPVLLVENIYKQLLRSR